MLIRSPEYRSHAKHDIYARELTADEPFVAYSPREMLLGQFVLILLFVIAILLRSVA